MVAVSLIVDDLLDSPLGELRRFSPLRPLYFVAPQYKCCNAMLQAAFAQRRVFFALWTKFLLSRYAMERIRLNLVVESSKRPKLA